MRRPPDAPRAPCAASLSFALFCLLAAGGCALPWGRSEPSAQEVEVLAARTASRRAEWGEAAGRWNAILQRGDEHSLEACAELSRATLELGDAAGAQRFAELGLRTFPRSADLHVCRARALVAQGFLNSAETAYESALAADPERLDVVLDLARLAGGLGRPEAALLLLEPRFAPRGSQPGPLEANATARILAAEAQHELGRFQDAFESYARAFELALPDAPSLVRAAALAEDERVRAELPRAAWLANGWLTRAVVLDPQCTRAHYLLGVLAESAEPAAAAAHYRRAVETDPAGVEALTALAKLQSRRGEVQDSIAMAQRALAVEKDPAKRAELERLAHPPDAAAADKPAGEAPRDQ